MDLRLLYEETELLAEMNKKKLAAMAAITGLGIGGYQLSKPDPEKPNQPDKPKSHQTVARPTPQIDNDTNYYADYIAANEGMRNRAYNDERGNNTIGIGHMFTPRSQAIFQRLFGEINYNDIVNGTATLTNDQIMALFRHDLQEHIERAERMFPEFDTYPLYLRAALLDSVYRGDTGARTRQLINHGDWANAAREYLNRRDYRNREQLGIRGIGPRMERNRDAMLRYARELANR